MAPYLLLLFVALAFGQSSNLPGRSCGERRCVKPNGRCDDPSQGICECKGNRQGDGYLACHETYEEVCALRMNSDVTNFNSDRVYRLPIPCRYLFAKFETTRTDNPDFKCQIMVFAHGERVWGRYFVRGFDAEVTTDSSGTIQVAGYRARGTRKQEGYLYTMEERGGPDEFWVETPAIDTPEVQFGMEDINSRVILEVVQCGLRVIFRPEMASEGKFQTVMPGLIVSIDKRSVEVTWPTAANPTEYPVCLTPTLVSGGPNREGVAEGLTFPRRSTYGMTYVAYTNADRSTHPSSACECDDVSTTLRRCTDLVKLRTAIEKCHFIVDRAPLVACLERRTNSRGSNIEDNRESSTLMSIFDQCLESFCLDKVGKCRRVQVAIRARNCQDDADPDFMNFDCNTITNP